MWEPVREPLIFLTKTKVVGGSKEGREEVEKHL